MNLTLLVQSAELLESKHKVHLHASSLNEIKAGLVKSLHLGQQELIIEIYDKEFEEFVALDNFSLLEGITKAKIRISAKKKNEDKIRRRDRTQRSLSEMILLVPDLVARGVINEDDKGAMKDLILRHSDGMKDALDRVERGEHDAIRSMLAKARGVDNSVRSKQNIGTWTDEENRAFVEGLEKYGRDWKNISTLVKTRNLTQIRSHAQKYFKKQERDAAKLRLSQQSSVASLGSGFDMDIGFTRGRVRSRTNSTELGVERNPDKRHARRRTPLQITELLQANAEGRSGFGSGGIHIRNSSIDGGTGHGQTDSLMSLSDLLPVIDQSMDTKGESSTELFSSILSSSDLSEIGTDRTKNNFLSSGPGDFDDANSNLAVTSPKPARRAKVISTTSDISNDEIQQLAATLHSPKK